MRSLCVGLIGASICVASCGGAGTPSNDPGIATVAFASGALPTGTAVVIEKHTDARTFSVFDDTASIYIPGSRAPYQVRVTTGTSQPAGPATVVMKIPSGFTAPSGYEIQAFGQIPQASDLEHYDAFEALPSASDLTNGTVTATVSPAVFTSNRTGDGTYEAILLLATVPVSTSSSQRELVGTGNCPTGHIRTPILRNLHVRSPFDPNRVVVVDGQTYTGHFGTDLVAESGTVAVAVAAGKVVSSYTSDTFGETVVLEIAGVGQVRYAHLAAGSRSVSAGDEVEAGQVIGQTDNTGLSSGPHLHFELKPQGSRNPVDPWPCIVPPDYDGTITSTMTGTAAGGDVTLEIDANVTFSYSEQAAKYQPLGSWSYKATGASFGCTAIGSGTGPIAAADGFLSFNDFNADPMTYTGVGISNGSIEVTVTCPGGSGQVSFPTIPWWLTNCLGNCSAGFQVKPDGSLSETNVLVLGEDGVTWTVSWKLSARTLGPTGP